ncbi:ABC transporter ATP-binding protein [Candidatus Heimdallarchaeota archaeon]|nr:MAG: ABC transporter ATP-binding protein [Candidatus Heimdallarchaeota archaeon]
MMIHLENITKKFSERVVLEEISLEIGQEIVALLGPNGAGKTTLVNIICGLLKRDGGTVSVNGLDPEKQQNQVRKKIGLISQETALYDYLTAKENLMFHARLYGVPRQKRKQAVAEALELAQLTDRANDRVKTFSGGMKRRLALVRALLHEPEILILDEPSLGIDVQNRNEIWNRILELNKESSKSIIVTTNYMDEADRLADRCAIIDDGKIIALDTPSKLKTTIAGGTRLEAFISLSSSKLKQLKEKLFSISPKTEITKQLEQDNYYVLMPAQAEANKLLTDVSELFQDFPTVKLLDLSLRIPTLDDVFLELTGSKLRD